MSWLGTYKYRKEVIVSNTNIDSNLTHFPLLLTLGISVGTGNTDVSDIFDELGSDANRLKIAFTKTDGTTQLYAEIEKWDDANEKAVIHTSKSDLVLASGATTKLYMYFDSAQDDNTTYIGDTNSVVAESVWDANFKMVQHMADGASTSATYDSTSNDNDGTKKGAGEPAVTTSGQIGNAQDGDETDDYINVGTLGTFGSEMGTNKPTMEFWHKSSNTDAHGMGLYTAGSSDLFVKLNYDSDNTNQAGYIRAWMKDDSARILQGAVNSNTGISDGSSHYIVIRWDAPNDNIDIFVDGVEKTFTYKAQGTPNSFNNFSKDFSLMAINVDGTQSSFCNIIDEIRLSNTLRSDAWIKANYYCQTDALVAWGATEEIPTTFIPKVTII